MATCSAWATCHQDFHHFLPIPPMHVDASSTLRAIRATIPLALIGYAEALAIATCAGSLRQGRARRWRAAAKRVSWERRARRSRTYCTWRMQCVVESLSGIHSHGLVLANSGKRRLRSAISAEHPICSTSRVHRPHRCYPSHVHATQSCRFCDRHRCHYSPY